MLHQTPNQPLLGDRKEDDLITESWLKYLDSGDESWPLLFPMVKSAVTAMDAVEAFSRAQFTAPIEKFVITGASKRGWTSWLTPVVDRRLIGTAPIVIDVLNFRAQMNHQLATWGAFSEQIIDYTRKGLVKRPGETETPREVALRTMMDPFTYRDQLTLPKLLIVGTNDPYWVVDAMNLYWDDLPGSKFIRQVPNAGHGLQGGQQGAMLSLSVFFRHLASARPLPTIDWEPAQGERDLQLTMTCDGKPKTVRLWSARSRDEDFRDDHWTSEVLSPQEENQWTGSAELEKAGHVAIFGEFEFDFSGYPWSLTTLVYRK
jgi:PhoPQ-activated pathogenicity-related protein